MSKDCVAVIVAHADDEVLGCGGTISRFILEGRQVHVLIMADGVSSRQSINDNLILEKSIFKRNRAAERANALLGVTTLSFVGYADNRLDKYELLDVISHIELFINKHQPEIVLTHHAGDVNIDHRIIHDAVIVATRPQPQCSVKELLFFEIPSSTEWRPQGSGLMFAPNYFVNISNFYEIKVKALRAYHEELRNFPHPRSLIAIEAQAKWRGATVGVDFAEAFILGRLIRH